MIVNKAAGLWSLKIEIGSYCEDATVKNEDLYIVFRGMRKDEMVKLKTFESSLLVEPERGIRFDLETDGKTKERMIAPDVEEKRLNFFDTLLGNCMESHNFESDTNKLMSKVEVWAWVKDRPSLFEFIVDEYRTKHPFFHRVSGTESKSE